MDIHGTAVKKYARASQRNCSNKETKLSPPFTIFGLHKAFGYRGNKAYKCNAERCLWFTL